MLIFYNESTIAAKIFSIERFLLSIYHLSKSSYFLVALKIVLLCKNFRTFFQISFWPFLDKIYEKFHYEICARNIFKSISSLSSPILLLNLFALIKFTMRYRSFGTFYHFELIYNNHWPTTFTTYNFILLTSNN